MKKGLIILSGGLDSSVLAHYLIKEKGYDLQALSFDYGQKHVRELECAKWQAQHLRISHEVVNLGFMKDLFKSDLLQTGGDIPQGHYEDANMKQTVVPNRNMILISIAAGVAISNKCTTIFYGAHSGDHAIYPDCRPQFIEKMKEVLHLCDWQDLNLEAPFQDFIKADIVKIGQNAKVDFKNTWTCYVGKEKACGKCGSCVERLEAFALNDLKDSLEYEC